jgi:hypothetical protein
MARTKGALGKKTLANRKNQNMAMGDGKYLFRATSCGCETRRDIVGCAMFCGHKNSMTLVQK